MINDSVLLTNYTQGFRYRNGIKRHAATAYNVWYKMVSERHNLHNRPRRTMTKVIQESSTFVDMSLLQNNRLHPINCPYLLTISRHHTCLHPVAKSRHERSTELPMMYYQAASESAYRAQISSRSTHFQAEASSKLAFPCHVPQEQAGRTPTRVILRR